MKQFPATPAAGAVPELFESGHLWLLEQVTGVPLRVQLQPSGLLRFGDGHRVYDDAGELPLSCQYAVRHVREHLDRDALRGAVDEPESVVLFGVATRYEGIDYDWNRLPGFLGVDVWAESGNAGNEGAGDETTDEETTDDENTDNETTDDEGAFRPPDAAETIFQRLGLHPVNTVERERRARDFDPESYDLPTSNWADGPAAGVLVRNKRGGRAVLSNPDAFGEPEPLDLPAEELAAEYATNDRFEAVAALLRERNWAVTVDELCDRVAEEIAREEYARLDAGKEQLDESAFRSAVARRARAFLGSD